MALARSKTVLSLAALLLLFAQTVAAGDLYYLIIWGSDVSPKRLKYTHTWATFIRATGEGSDPANYALAVHSISWLPATLNIRVWDLVPEPGVNLEMIETLDAVMSQGESVTAWGPFVIRPELYALSLRQWAWLHSGIVRYRAIDGPWDREVSDCIHAITDVYPGFGRGHYPLIRIGKPASAYIARQFKARSFYNQDLYDNRWLISRLGLDRYPIEFISPQETPRAHFARPGRYRVPVQVWEGTPDADAAGEVIGPVHPVIARQEWVTVE
jgi:hypothetical protein